MNVNHAIELLKHIEILMKCMHNSLRSIDILTKKGITNLENFLSFSLSYNKFQKISKTILKTVVDEATEIFFMSLNGDNYFPHISFDLNVFLFQENSKCTENQK